MAEGSLQLSVVVPTYNERENLTPLVERVFAAVDPAHSEMIIVDDNSPDGTAELARHLAEAYPLRAVVRRAERGLATAVVRGLDEAAGALCVVLDADLSHPPEAIPRLVEALRDPALDVAIGSRFVRGGKVDLHWPLHRRMNSLLGRVLARPLTPVRDMMSGFFCVRRASLRLAGLNPIGYKILLELLVRHRWTRVVEIPITFTDRSAGKTKLTVSEQLRYLRHLGRLYADVCFRRRAGDS